MQVADKTDGDNLCYDSRQTRQCDIATTVLTTDYVIRIFLWQE